MYVPETKRRAAFQHLVDLEDAGTAASTARRWTALQFDLEPTTVTAIVAEGVRKQWAPLEAGRPSQARNT